MNRERLIAVAAGREKADLVLKNVNLVNTLSGEIYITDVAVAEGYVAGIVPGYEGENEVDCKGMFLCPGFIDGHVHIESSMVAVPEFARAVVPRGTTTVIADPHEIANVLGNKGIRYILDSSETVPLNIYVMVPSCVPATPLETSGAELKASDLAVWKDDTRVIGLGEFMNYPGIIQCFPDVMDKVRLFSDKIIDGHAPMVTGKELCAYRAAGVTSEHECTTASEALEKLRMGMYIMLREGSATKNLHDLMPLLNKFNERFCFFSTDDRHPDDLIREGHIDNMVKILVREQGNIVRAVRLASKNAAEYFCLKDLGAVAPGYRADMLLVEDFENMSIKAVYKDGVKVAEDGKALFETGSTITREEVTDTVRFADIKEEKIRVSVPASGEYKMNVIEIIPSQIVTRHIKVRPSLSPTGEVIPDIVGDILKFCVIERHNGTGNIGVGFVKGMGLKSGAIGTTVSHDSHNVNIIGTNDRDIIECAHQLRKMGGGIAVVEDGKLRGSLSLPVAGLMSEKSLTEVSQAISELHDLVHGMGVILKDPFITMAFLALPVIPELKLTDKGLVDVSGFCFTELLEEL